MTPCRPEIFARSHAMKAALEAVHAAASARGGVLVCGESGSGRLMLAREIHHLSKGNGAPFVAVDCAEIDDAEAALFGTAPPAGSGDAARRGLDRIARNSLLHRAIGGTLFLAHLPDMPARVQARLARVLRDGEVRLAGTRGRLPAGMRLVVSADPGWENAVAEGQIRADLSRRCAGVRVAVPRLCDRRDDIPALAASFLEEICGQSGMGPRAIDPAAMALLRALPWRGNARELRALIGALAQRTSAPAIRLEDVLATVNVDGSVDSFVARGTLREAKERFERNYIAAVLERHRGRMAEAAAALGIQRPNLYRKMRALKLSPGPARPYHS